MPRPSIAQHPSAAEILALIDSSEGAAAICEQFPDIKPASLRKFMSRRRAVPPEPPQSSATSGARPSVQLDGDKGTATSRVYSEAQAEGLGHDDLIRGWKLDPAEWEIDGNLGVNRWMQNAEDPDSWCLQYKAQLRRAGSHTALTLPPPVHVTLRTPARLPKRSQSSLGVAIVYMDAQIGYWQHPDTRELISIHDEAALDISLQVTEYLEALSGVDYLIDIGDTGDNPMFSTRHASAIAYHSVSAGNAANARIGRLWAERSACAPNAEGKVIRGNHDQRVLTYLEQCAPKLVGARDSEGNLLVNLDRMYGISAAGWELVGDSYTNSRFWLNHNTLIEHGTKAGKAVAAAYLSQEVNRIFGHTPWMQSSHRTVTTGEEPRTYVAAGGGGFMKVQGHLPPGIYTGRKEDGTPGEGNAPWQQGFWVVSYDPAGELVPQCEPVLIIDGWATFRGMVFRARCDADGNPLG